LGGGGARGLAHIGAVKVLRSHGIPIDVVAGTSMGGIIGALVAAGVSVDQMLEELQLRGVPREIFKLVDIRITRGGLLKGTRIYNYLAQKIGDTLTFADLRAPLAMVAVDVVTGREVVLQEGLVVDALRATISVPGFFEPVDRGPLRLVDGGILNNVPVDVARHLGADFVLAVDVLPSFRYNVPGQPAFVRPVKQGPLPKNVNELAHVLTIMLSAITELKLQDTPPDVLIEPILPNDIGLLVGFERWQEAVAAGAAATEAAMPHILAQLESAARQRRSPLHWLKDLRRTLAE
jgi:NTE family protein